MAEVIGVEAFRTLRDLRKFKEKKGPRIQEALRALSNLNLMEFNARGRTKVYKMFIKQKRWSLLLTTEFETGLKKYLELNPEPSTEEFSNFVEAWLSEHLRISLC